MYNEMTEYLSNCLILHCLVKFSYISFIYISLIRNCMPEENELKPVKFVSYAFSIANFIVWAYLLGVLKIPLVNLVHKLKSLRLFAKLDNKHEMFYQTKL